jgi:hypothetical protein
VLCYCSTIIVKINILVQVGVVHDVMCELNVTKILIICHLQLLMLPVMSWNG